MGFWAEFKFSGAYFFIFNRVSTSFRASLLYLLESLSTVFFEFSTSNHLVFSHNLELSLLYLSYRDSLFVRVCFVIKSLVHELFFIVLTLVTVCGLERACEFMFIVRVRTSEGLANLRVLEGTCVGPKAHHSSFDDD